MSNIQGRNGLFRLCCRTLPRNIRNPHPVLSQPQNICRNTLAARPEQAAQRLSPSKPASSAFQPLTGRFHFRATC